MQPPQFRLVGRHTAIWGLKHSGKSNFLQWLLTRPRYEDSHVVYDVNREHEALTRYLPEHRRGDEAEAELDGVVSRLITDQDRDMRPEVFALEEVSRFTTARSRPPEALYELVDLARHYGVGLITVARRPAQVHSDLTELADNHVFFRLKGDNDYRKLDRMISGLGDVVRNLDGYEFARVTGDRRVFVHDPVPEMETTGVL